MSDNPFTDRRAFSPIPVSAGIGLKPQHFEEILQAEPAVGWFEVHPENYLMPGGPMHYYLSRIRDRFPLSFHSVGMSLGSGSGIRKQHVMKLKALCDRYQPGLVSDHLSWSRWHQFSLNDLLPMPYTRAALDLMVDNVDQVQSLLGRPIAIENPSSYLLPGEAEMTEWEFLVELASRSGASILLDVNNIYVSTKNHGWSAAEYISRIPRHMVSEMHVAGHKREQSLNREILIDDHGSSVSDAVWQLFELALQTIGPVPSLIEWDTDVPAFQVLSSEAEKIASRLLVSSNHSTGASAGNRHYG
jgi:uncharacterized protein